jgi:hypothetical protein
VGWGCDEARITQLRVWGSSPTSNDGDLISTARWGLRQPTAGGGQRLARRAGALPILTFVLTLGYFGLARGRGTGNLSGSLNSQKDYENQGFSAVFLRRLRG